MLKFFAIVTVCGLYQGHVDTCLEQRERAGYATRTECIARAQTMQKTAKTAFRYARIPEPHTVKIRCLEEATNGKK